MNKKELFNDYDDQFTEEQKVKIVELTNELLNDVYLKMLSKRSGYYSYCKISDVDEIENTFDIDVIYGVQDGVDNWEDKYTCQYDLKKFEFIYFI